MSTDRVGVFVHGACTVGDCEYRCQEFQNGGRPEHLLCVECGHVRSRHPMQIKTVELASLGPRFNTSASSQTPPAHTAPGGSNNANAGSAQQNTNRVASQSPSNQIRGERRGNNAGSASNSSHQGTTRDASRSPLKRNRGSGTIDNNTGSAINSSHQSSPRDASPLNQNRGGTIDDKAGSANNSSHQSTRDASRSPLKRNRGSGAGRGGSTSSQSTTPGRATAAVQANRNDLANRRARSMRGAGNESPSPAQWRPRTTAPATPSIAPVRPVEEEREESVTRSGRTYRVFQRVRATGSGTTRSGRGLIVEPWRPLRPVRNGVPPPRRGRPLDRRTITHRRTIAHRSRRWPNSAFGVVTRSQKRRQQAIERNEYDLDFHPMPHRVSALLDNNPAPRSVQLEHAWNDNDRSRNLKLNDGDPLTVHRHPVAQSTDAVRGKQGYTEGIHAFEIHWPAFQRGGSFHRGTHASVGVSTSDCPLHAESYLSLVGKDEHSWGWDLAHNKLYHNGEYMEKKMKLDTERRVAPDRFIVILDLDEGYLGYVVDGRFMGRCHQGLKRKKLYLTVSSVWGHAEISMRYIGGIDPGPLPLMDLCRYVIRQKFSEASFPQLPLPKTVKEYLKKQELMEEKQ